MEKKRQNKVMTLQEKKEQRDRLEEMRRFLKSWFGQRKEEKDG